MDFDLDDLTVAWTEIATMAGKLLLPAMGYLCVILIGGVVALRFFYIQKRHERMANKYDDLLVSMQISINVLGLAAEGQEVPDLNLRADEAFNKLKEIYATSRLYLSDETSAFLGVMFEKASSHIPNLQDDKKRLEALRLARADFLEAREQLIEQAKVDLRPNFPNFLAQLW